MPCKDDSGNNTLLKDQKLKKVRLPYSQWADKLSTGNFFPKHWRHKIDGKLDKEGNGCTLEVMAHVENDLVYKIWCTCMLQGNCCPGTEIP